MSASLLYYAFLTLELFVAMAMATYAVSMFYSYLRGAPYVATSKKQIQNILQHAALKKGQTFLELGCGDGRVVRTAVKEYGVIGQGVDINKTLIWLAKIRASFQGIPNITFTTGSIYSTDLSDADVIYIFLFPKMVDKLQKQLLTTTKKNVLIISHGFRIKYLEKYLIKTIEDKPFPTFIYKK